MAIDSAITVVVEGEAIPLPSGFPVETKEHIVKASCERPRLVALVAVTTHADGGQWACVTHQLVHRNNLSASLHEAEPGDHRVVWVCFEHGPEVP